MDVQTPNTRKAKKPIKYTAITVAILFSGASILFYILGASEYCFKKKKWVSDQEKISAAIDFLLETYSFATSTRQVFAPNQSEQPQNTHTPIKYKNRDDFIKQNPDCCNLIKDPNFQFDIIEMLFVSNSSELVQIKYKITNEERQITEYHQFTTCGEHISVIR